MSIEGQIERQEAQQLIQLARQVPKELVIVEIGSYRGRSTVALALGSLMGNKNPVYAIDPHVEFKGIMGGTFGPEDQAHLYKNIGKAHVGHIVSVISLPSVSVAKIWPAKNVGLLWIDGDHTYEAISSDYHSWKPNLYTGSIIAFHDTNLESIQELVREIIAENEVKRLGTVELLQSFMYLG